MNPTLQTPLLPRPRDSGPFFDYVREAMREHARRERSQLLRLAQREQRLAKGRQIAEQRWEGEGGSTGEGLASVRASSPG